MRAARRRRSTLGALTLTVTGEQGPFDLMDLGLVERLARNLALVIRADAGTGAAPSSPSGCGPACSPASCRPIPGAEVAGRHHPRDARERLRRRLLRGVPDRRAAGAWSSATCAARATTPPR